MARNCLEDAHASFIGPNVENVSRSEVSVFHYASSDWRDMEMEMSMSSKNLKRQER